MVIMALEAVKQTYQSTRKISAYNVQEAHFLNPIVVGNTEEESTEVIVQLRHVQATYEKESLWSEIKIMARTEGHFSECFKARIQIQYTEEVVGEVDAGLEKQLWAQRMVEHFAEAVQACDQTIDHRAFYQHHDDAGNSYGKTFRLLENICWDGDSTASAQIFLSKLPNHVTASLTHPAVLDCALQLLLAQATKGLSDKLYTFVPNSISDMWVAAEGWQPPDTATLRILAETTENSSSENIEASVYILADASDDLKKAPLCSIGKVEMSPVSGRQQTNDEQFDLLHTVQWRPQLSMMTPQQIQSMMSVELSTESSGNESLAEFLSILEPLLNRILAETSEGLLDEDLVRVPESLKKYVKWMQHHVTNIAHPPAKLHQAQKVSIEAQLQLVEQMYPAWNIFPAIARNLKPILLGETDPLPLAFDPATGLAEAFYSNIFRTSCDDNFKNLIDLLSHETPTLRILEVGAGTGSITNHILSALKNLEDRTGGMRFSEYVFTDISPSFLEGAQTRFQVFGSRMSFKTLDLDKTPTEQGLEESAYDIVVAGCVLHATRDIKATLSNVRQLLKPGGHLLYLEVVVPEKVITNFAFGVLPGWWSSTEEFRSLSPVMTESQWDLVLRDTGFSGNDVVLKDHDGIDHIFSTMLTTRNGDIFAALDRTSRQRLFVVSREQDDPAVMEVVNYLNKLPDSHWDMRVLNLEQMKDSDVSTDDIVVLLLEIRDPLLTNISESDYEALKVLMMRARNFFWITVSQPGDNRGPEFETVQGFLRSIRSEHAEKHIVTVAIEGKVSVGASFPALDCVGKIFALTFNEENRSDELEFRVHDGHILTGRLTEETELNNRLRCLIRPQQIHESWGKGPPVKLVTGITGFLDTLEFVEDSQPAELGPNEVEIKLKACALNFRDVFVALGRLPGKGLGYDCAGIVTRTGSAVEGRFQPGDRVVGGSFGAMRTYPRIHTSTLAKVPDTVSLEVAASFMTPGITAYHSLIKVARLQKSDKILIHSAAGATGQMAVRVAQMVGAEIFATVGMNSKKEFLIGKFGIPANHIFYSRDTSFAQGLKRMTGGYGVDVVLNSLAGDSLRASWECIAPFGRFIEIGKADITENSALPMAGFSRNISFHAVDIHHIGVETPELAGKLFQDSMRLLFDGSIQHPQPLNRYPASDVETAFRYLQGGRSTGRIVVGFDASDVVLKRLIEKTDWNFDSDATYVIVGGLGGLGRAISRWMVNKGAKNLILLSRSGTTSQAAADLVSELERRGVVIAAPKCDAGSEISLKAVLEDCANNMRPIKGCINAAMALNDSLFENMSYKQWTETLNSKVQSSYNLNRLLPDSVDFFILLSSLSGIYGSISQPNYAAGCAFQDALARHRVANGKPAVSLDLGWMRNIGIIAETEAYQENRLIVYNMMPIDDIELMALLDLYCQPAVSSPIKGYSQLLVGPVTPAQCLRRGLDVSPLALRPLFAPFSMLIGENQKSAGTSLAFNFATLFRQASSAEERAAVVVQGLIARLARAMAIPIEDVEPSRHLSDYGVDSLMAMELRNWMSRDFGAHVAVFDIMGSATIGGIGELVEERSEVVKSL